MLRLPTKYVLGEKKKLNRSQVTTHVCIFTYHYISYVSYIPYYVLYSFANFLYKVCEHIDEHCGLRMVSPPSLVTCVKIHHRKRGLEFGVLISFAPEHITHVVKVCNSKAFGGRMLTIAALNIAQIMCLLESTPVISLWSSLNASCHFGNFIFPMSC